MNPTPFRILKFATHDDIMRGENNLKVVCFFPTEKCNLKCSWCNAHTRVAQNISLDLAKTFFKNAKELGTKSISFCGGGEPYLHPDIAEMLEIAQQDFETSSITNGTLLHRIPIELFKKMTWMRISVNGGPKTYTDIHKSNQYARVIENVHLVAPLEGLKVGVNCVWDHQSDFDDTIQIMKDTRDSGIEYFRVAGERYTQNGKPSRPIPYDDFIKHVPDGVTLELDHFRNGNVPKDCLTHWHKPVADADGFVYPCVLNRTPLCRIEDMVEHWRSGKNVVDTSKCDWCLFGDVNTFLNELAATRERPDLNSL